MSDKFLQFILLNKTNILHLIDKFSETENIQVYWLVGLFYSMFTLVGLFNGKASIFSSSNKDCKQLQLQVTILNTNNLHTVIQYQVFLSNTNNFQTDLFDP